ncbi:MAG: GDSL-type esterase/lipase family protein [Thermoplasmata archaeon]|nr:GDSL-type esterase/lipase family protein [Thermoplasmata archaeon]
MPDIELRGSTQGTSRSPRSLRIVALGDSTTAGTPGFRSPREAPPTGEGDTQSQYAYWMVRTHPEWTVLNRGVNGETTTAILSRFEADVLSERPDYVIILAGVNDVFQGRTAAQIFPNLEQLYLRSVAARIRVIGASMLPYNSISREALGQMRWVNRWIEQTASGLGFRFFDAHALLADPNIDGRLIGSPDGLHPDVAGYRKLGEALATVLEEEELREYPGSR